MGPFASIRAYRPSCGIQDEAALKKYRVAKLYDRVSASLARRGISSSKCTSAQLAKTVANLRAFCMHYLGSESESDARDKLTIFPSYLFDDFSEHGSVCCILQSCFNFAEEHQIGEIDFSDADNVDVYVRMLVYVEKVLKSEGHLKRVKAFIASSNAERDSERLQHILQKHGGAILSTPDVATHVIYPDPHGTKEHQTDDQVLIRVLARDTFDGDEDCFVHWMHQPDSYNDWVPRDEVLGHVYIPKARREIDQWHVHSRWVRDLELHNEWMNELDYEMPPSFEDYVGRAPPDPCTETQNPSLFSRVRLRLRITDKAKEEGKLGTDAAFRMVGLPSIAQDEQQNGMARDDDGRSGEGDSPGSSSESSVVEHDAVEEGVLGSESDLLKKKRQGDQAGQSERIALGDGVFMPSFSKWFELNSVNDIERRALPEFFMNKFASKTGTAYRDIRNFMIRTWRKNPKGYLSGTAARRHLSGDACAILRVHGFLEHWGLINYACPDAAPPPSFNPPPKPLPLYAGIDNDVAARKSLRLLLDNGSKAELKNMRIVQYGTDGEPLTNTSSGSVLIRESDKTGHSAQIAEKPAKEPIEYHCDSCGIDCSQLRFHCATKADVDLCASCYQNERYSSTMKHRDFIQMNSAHGGAEDDDSDVWTESETLLLLEALEMYADNWQLVSEHVGSKGKNQCVVQFLRLPIEDAFLKNTLKRWWSEHPGHDEEMPSPADIMKKAGARESALAAIATKGSAGKSYSGQPLVFGDQLSTIVPFASGLSSLTAPTMLKEIAEGLDVDNPRMRERDPFRAIIEAKDRNEGNETSNSKLTELFRIALSTELYQEMLRKVKVPAEVLKTEYCDVLSQAAYALLNHGSMAPQEKVSLKFHRSSCNVLKHFCSGNGTSDDVDGLANGGDTTDSQKSAVAAEREDKSHERDSEADSASSTAVAITSLAAAAVTAAQLRQVEETEISRLRALCTEMRMAMIRRKLKHLADISVHEKLSSEYRKRRRIEDFAERIKRKVQRLDTMSRMNSNTGIDSCTEERPRCLRASDEGDAGFAPTLRIQACSGDNVVKAGGSGMKSMTDEADFEARLAKEVLPNFSDEVSLHVIRGASVDGAVVAEETDADVMKDVAEGPPAKPTEILANEQSDPHQVVQLDEQPDVLID